MSLRDAVHSVRRDIRSYKSGISGANGGSSGACCTLSCNMSCVVLLLNGRYYDCDVVFVAGTTGRHWRGFRALLETR
jgi:hypothetical protein